MNFTIEIITKPTGETSYSIEVTEDYEGDKWHVVVYESNTLPYEHYETIGFNTEREVFEYIRELQNQEG
jgi:hypothetical protein